MFEGKSILITGGTGSMGRTLVRKLLAATLGTPKKVTVFSRDEAKQHRMRLEYLHKAVATDEVIYRNFMRTLQFKLGDIRDYHDVCSALRGVDIVINAAALKQVPSCEYFPDQALYTNCLGAINITRAIAEHELPVEAVVCVSTDKAVNPINVMGITKALQERIFIAANINYPRTRFLCVRYGNVLVSRGSVIPLFKEQIASGVPVTITAPEMTRFLLSLDEAALTVFAALKNGKAGDIFVPRIPSVKMQNVAKALVGDRKIEIVTTGIRPGEKIHEVLISREEALRSTSSGDYYIIHSMLPEINPELPAGILKQEYSSEANILSLEETFNFLKGHGLLSEQQNVTEDDTITTFEDG